MAVLEVFADVACPFTHLVLRRVVEERARRGRDDLLLRVRAWPLEVVNDTPHDPAFVAEEVEAIRRVVGRHWCAGFDEAAFPRSSLAALDVAHAAYRVSDLVGERVSLVLRRALFEEGCDVSDPAVLARIAAAYGVLVDPQVDRAGVLADLQEGRARGVRGSPEFVVGEAGWFCPLLEVRSADGRVRVRPDEAGTAAFFDACFGR